MMADRAYLERLTRDLADSGKLIEAGFVAFRLSGIPLDTPGVSLNAIRMAYMAGAQHTFASIMTMLDPGVEETEADLRRMSLIDAELRAFGDELMARVPTKGNA